tara:strand:- start:190 stop:492 length:303 start_codon:yes stop_codon:yes gene_type:complete
MHSLVLNLDNINAFLEGSFIEFLNKIPAIKNRSVKTAILKGSKIFEIGSITFSKNQKICPFNVLVNLKMGMSKKEKNRIVMIMRINPKLIDLKIKNLFFM